MGMKAIEAKKKEYAEKAASLDTFVDVANKVRDELGKVQTVGAKLEKAVNKSYDQRSALLPSVEKIETTGSKQSELLKANLIAVCKGETPRLLPIPPSSPMTLEHWALTQAIHKRLQKIQDLCVKQEEAIKDLYAKKQKLVPVVEKTKTHGIKEFEAYKKSLLAICNSESHMSRPLPIAPLRKYVSEARKESADLLRAWVDKQTAKMPKVIKKGMAFRDYRMDRIYEVVSNETKSTNVNLKGEAAIFVDCKWTDLKTGKAGGSALPFSRAQLSPANQVKYLKL